MRFPLLGGATEALDTAARALRLVRISGGVAIHFTHTSRKPRQVGGDVKSNRSPAGSRAWCETTLHEGIAMGGVAPTDFDHWVDVLDEQGDILQEVTTSLRTFDYLQRTLRCYPAGLRP